MGFNSDDIVPMNQVRASFTDLAEQVRNGKEKIITRNGESYVALVDARRLDHYHRLEREHIHLTLIDEAARGITDIDAGRTMSVAEVRGSIGIRRSVSARAGSCPRASVSRSILQQNLDSIRRFLWSRKPKQVRPPHHAPFR